MASAWFALVLVFGLAQAADPIVKVEQGSLQGKEVQGANGTKSYFAFKGVPFGQPPVGSLRFRAPRPAQAWTGVRTADTEGTVCTQPTFTGTIVGGEDCLYLNVYTPTVTCEKPLPVLVWFFGGAFTYGDGGSGWYGPDFIVNKDVVMVSANYRVGPQGFLNLETAGAPGNAGLKDVKLALEWAKKNVAAFCGDPNQVTVGGFSAGSMMSHTLVVNPRSQGLFNRAVLMSGNALTPVAHRDDHLAAARALGAVLGAKDNETATLQAAFAAATTEQLTGASVQILLAEAQPFTQPKMAMSSEKEAASEADLAGSTLLTTDPETLIRTRAVPEPVPILAGHSNKEALSLYLVALATPVINGSETALLQQLSNRFPEVLQELALPVPVDTAKLLRVQAGVGTTAQQTQIRQLLEKAYFNGQTTFNRDQYSALTSGAEFWGPTLNYLHLCRGEVSLYETNVEIDYNFVTKYLFVANFNTTTAHGDDLGYVFHPTLVDMKQDFNGAGEDAAVLRYTTNMITDFIKGNAPATKATCGSTSPQPYVLINGASPAVASGFGSSHAVWRQVFDMRRRQ